MQIIDISCSFCHTIKNVILAKLTKEQYERVFKGIYNEDDSDIPLCKKCLKRIRNNATL